MLLGAWTWRRRFGRRFAGRRSESDQEAEVAQVDRSWRRRSAVRDRERKSRRRSKNVGRRGRDRHQYKRTGAGRRRPGRLRIGRRGNAGAGVVLLAAAGIRLPAPGGLSAICVRSCSRRVIGHGRRHFTARQQGGAYPHDQPGERKPSAAALGPACGPQTGGLLHRNTGVCLVHCARSLLAPPCLDLIQIKRSLPAFPT